MYHVTWSIRGHVPAKRGQNLNQLTNLRGHGHEKTAKTWYIFNTKNPAKSEDIQKNYDKNIKTPANRTRKLLAYLYYNKKSRPDAKLSGGLILFIFDCVSYVIKCNF